MMCLLLSRGLSKDLLADYIERAKARPQITRQSVEPVDATEAVKPGLAVFFSSSSALASSSWLRFLPIMGARMKMPFSPRFTNRPIEFQVRIPATLEASGFCKAPTHYPCFERRHDPLSVPSALWPDGDNGAKVFPPRTAPRSGSTSQWRSASSPRVDVG